MTFTAPAIMMLARRWVCHRHKEPCNQYGEKYSIAPTAEGQSITWTSPYFWLTFNQAVRGFERNTSGKIDGVGIVLTWEQDRGIDQIITVDLDLCRDPTTGVISPWATEMLRKLNSPSEASLSGTGVHIYCLGMLLAKNGIPIASATGHGPDDLTPEAKEHILAKKPDIKPRLDKGEAVWNGLEVYMGDPMSESGVRHMTVSGQWFPEYPPEMDNRSRELAEIISAPYIKANEPKKPRSAARSPKRTRRALNEEFPIDILNLINTSGFTQEGNQLAGPNPVLGSTSGHNLVVNPDEGTWANMHNFAGGTAPGGKGWEWLACEAGLVAWDAIGPGAMNNREIIEKVKQYAIGRGLFTENELFAERKAEISEEDLRAYSLPSGPKFECRLPDDHFIQRFMAYGADVSDAYPDYWFAGGIFSLAVVADKKLKIVLKQGTYYPNLYIMILGK